MKQYKTKNQQKIEAIMSCLPIQQNSEEWAKQILSKLELIDFNNDKKKD